MEALPETGEQEVRRMVMVGCREKEGESGDMVRKKKDLCSDGKTATTG